MLKRARRKAARKEAQRAAVWPDPDFLACTKASCSESCPSFGHRVDHPAPPPHELRVTRLHSPLCTDTSASVSLTLSL